MPDKKKVARCIGITVTGRTCRCRTARGPYCWRHLEKAKGLRIKKSTIPQANLGLFTTKDRKKNEVLVDYGGILKVSDRHIVGPYVLEIARTKYLDADPMLSNKSVGGYANNCRTVNKQRRECQGNNSNFKPNQRRTDANLKTTKPIKKGQEVFASYGRAYGNQF